MATNKLEDRMPFCELVDDPYGYGLGMRRRKGEYRAVLMKKSKKTGQPYMMWGRPAVRVRRKKGEPKRRARYNKAIPWDITLGANLEGAKKTVSWMHTVLQGGLQEATKEDGFLGKTTAGAIPFWEVGTEWRDGVALRYYDGLYQVVFAKRSKQTDEPYMLWIRPSVYKKTMGITQASFQGQAVPWAISIGESITNARLIVRWLYTILNRGALPETKAEDGVPQHAKSKKQKKKKV